MSEKTNVSNSNKKLLILQAVRAIATLVLICLVCGVLLALCNDLLYVSDMEKLSRKLSKIYPGTFAIDEDFDTKPDSKFQKESYGEVVTVYKATNGDYVLESVGNEGFGSGSVTLYVAIDAKKETIIGWSIKDNKGQTFIGNITEKQQKKWYVGKRVDGDLSMGNNKVSGTTMSSTAINNAIRIAASYCTKILGMGVDYEGDAKAAVIALLTAENEGYANYELTNREGVLAGKYNGKTIKEIWSDDDNTLSYYFRADGDLGEIQAFVYGQGEGQKIVVLSNTSTLICQSENVEGNEEFVTNVTENKVYISNFGKTRYAYIVSQSTNNGQTTYKVVGLKIGTVPNNYVLDIVIKEATAGGHGEVVSVALSTDPSGDGYVKDGPEHEDANKLLSSGALVGATLDTIDSIYSGNKVTGATESADLIAIAVKAALADFDSLLHA